MLFTDPDQSSENIIPEDLTYLPGGDGPPSSEPPSGRGWLRDLIFPSLKFLVLLPVLKMAIWTSVTAAVLLAVGWCTSSPWLSLPAKFLSGWNNMETWTEQTQQWSKKIRAQTQQLLKSTPAESLPQNISEDVLHHPTTPPELLNLED